jgi:hypothetical protein
MGMDRDTSHHTALALGESTAHIYQTTGLLSRTCFRLGWAKRKIFKDGLGDPPIRARPNLANSTLVLSAQLGLFWLHQMISDLDVHHWQCRSKIAKTQSFMLSSFRYDARTVYLFTIVIVFSFYNAIANCWLSPLLPSLSISLYLSIYLVKTTTYIGT